MQTIQRKALKSHFVPHTAGGAAARADDAGMSPRTARGLADGATVRRAPRSGLLRLASTIFWAVIGHTTFVRAVSQDRVPAALIGGSLAAGTAYLQDRAAGRTDLVSPHAVSKRSVFSLYAVIGFGLGLGALLGNRRRGL